MLVTGVSGVGYAYPGPWPAETFHLFTELTGRYADLAGLDVVWVFNMRRGQPVEVTQSEIQAYVDDADPLGLMLMYSAHGVRIVSGTTPASPTLGAVTVEQAQTQIAQASAGWDHSSPLFLSVYMSAWDMSPSDVVTIVDPLGPEYVVVRGDHFLELIREALGVQAGT